MNLTIISKTTDFITASAELGGSIDEACTDAIAMSAHRNCPVHFDFNGITVVATATDTADVLVSKYKSDVNEQHSKFMASPEGIQHQRDMQTRFDHHEAETQRLIDELPSALQSQDSTVAWVGQFAEVSDYINLSYDKQSTAAMLESAGYIRDDCVGDAEVKTDKTKFARWLVGQAIDMLRCDMGIHPMMSKFATDYDLM